MKNTMPTLKDPKELLDSVGDGALSVIQVFPRVAQNLANVAVNYANGANNNINKLKNNLPDNPVVIPEVVAGAIEDTVKAGIGIVESFAKAGESTAADIKSQVNRITR